MAGERRSWEMSTTSAVLASKVSLRLLEGAESSRNRNEGGVGNSFTLNRVRDGSSKELDRRPRLKRVFETASLARKGGRSGDRGSNLLSSAAFQTWGGFPAGAWEPG